jgi:hypothetical protein
VRAEAVPRLTAGAGATPTADGSPVEDHEVARGHVRDPVAHRVDDTGRFMPEKKRKVVVDATLAVVQVGVAHTAGLHRDARLARSRVRHHDADDLDRSALRPCDDPTKGLGHDISLR